MRKRSKAGGIIFNEDFTEILLIKGRYGLKWGVPKGHTNLNEKFLMCCCREIFEETGISIIFCNKSPQYISFDRAKLYILHANKSKCKLDPQDTDEIIDIGWKKISDLSDPGLKCTRMVEKLITRLPELVKIAKTVKCSTVNSVIIVT